MTALPSGRTGYDCATLGTGRRLSTLRLGRVAYDYATLGTNHGICSSPSNGGQSSIPFVLSVA